MLPDAPEATLIARAQAGDRHAFGQLAALHAVRLFTFLARRSGQLTRAGRTIDTEDLCQITLLRAWLHIETYRPERAAFSTWLLTIANRVAITQSRSQRPLASIPDEHSDARTPSPAAALTRTETSDNLWHLVDRVLTPDAATAVWLRYAESLEIADIANVLSWPSVRVRVTLHRARAQLLAALQAQDTTNPHTHTNTTPLGPTPPIGAAHAPSF